MCKYDNRCLTDANLRPIWSRRLQKREKQGEALRLGKQSTVFEAEIFAILRDEIMEEVEIAARRKSASAQIAKQL